MHLASAAQSVPAEIRVYNQLFAIQPECCDFAADLQIRNRWEILPDARIEPSVAASNSGEVISSNGKAIRARRDRRANRVQPHHRPARHLARKSAGKG